MTFHKNDITVLCTLHAIFVNIPFCLTLGTMKELDSILIIDSDRKSSDLVSAFLTYRGYQVVIFQEDMSFFDIIGENIGIVIAELPYLKRISPGFEEKFKKIKPLLSLITYDTPETSKKFPAGNEHTFILSKPINLEELESIVTRAREHQALKLQSVSDVSSLQTHTLCTNIIGRSKPMSDLFELIEKVAASSATVLIQGESGTGKELAARAIHQLSQRRNKNFVPVNCAAIPDDLLESELFGHVKGSFTGAYANRAGRFEMADKGTLFLDEVGDMKANLQVKLLRVLQSREFEPVGSTKSQKVDVRIIAATNKNLEEMVKTRDFREDLYYRLSVIPITIPPLRDRRDDIPLLVHSFLTRFNGDRKHAVQGFSRECLDILCAYDWPGNVRELENLVERVVILKDSGVISSDDLPEKYLSGKTVVPVKAFSLPEDPVFLEEGICLNSAVDLFENRLIQQALIRTKGNKKEAASLLNLKRTTLIEKLKKKNLTINEEGNSL